jgi:hypothetical protein
MPSKLAELMRQGADHFRLVAVLAAYVDADPNQRSVCRQITREQQTGNKRDDMEF